MQDIAPANDLPTSVAAIMQQVSHETPDPPAETRDLFGLMSDVVYFSGQVLRYATIVQTSPSPGSYRGLLTDSGLKANRAYITYLRALDPATLQEHKLEL